MFGKTKNPGLFKDESSISDGSCIEGNMFFNAKMQIHGMIKGRVFGKNDKSQLIIFASGSIDGDVSAANVQVDGLVKGNIACRSIDIRKNARIVGNIYYEVLQIEANSTINGKLVISDEYNKQLVAYAKEQKNQQQAISASTKQTNVQTGKEKIG